jgi:hypothetical protein
MTDAQIDCINQNLKEGVDLTQPGMRAGKALGIHGLYGQKAPKEIVEDAGFFDMLRMAGIEPRLQTEAEAASKEVAEAFDIEQFAGRKDVKRRAVENFLGSLTGLSKADALGNLKQDAKDYKWNAATVAAIQAGIQAFFKG